MTTAAAKIPSSRVRPTLSTKFHIAREWWERAGRELEVYLRDHLCPEHQREYDQSEPGVNVDHVDPRSGEVTVVNRFQHLLISHCSQLPNYVTPQMSLINAVFRIFLANGNLPQTPEQLAQRTGRSPQMILRTLSGPRIYKGIRPLE
ncbi:MAG: hypothetical protein ACRDHG_05805 [Anaerolineales bacterium]